MYKPKKTSRIGKPQNAAQRAASIRNWNTFQLRGVVASLYVVKTQTDIAELRSLVDSLLTQTNAAIILSKLPKRTNEHPIETP
jgi:hypothetical protein